MPHKALKKAVQNTPRYQLDQFNKELSKRKSKLTRALNRYNEQVERFNQFAIVMMKTDEQRKA